MNEQTVNQPLDDEQAAESTPLSAEKGFWADHLLQFNPSFVLGHPYLQGQWGQYQQDRRKHLVQTLLICVILLGLAVLSTRIPYYFLYYIIPALCLGYGIFSLRKWKKKNAQLSRREKELVAASDVLKQGTASVVQYSVEDIGQSTMHVLKNAAPMCRVMLDGEKSVPKYCGSWPVRNWRTLTESDRYGLHSEYRSYVTGKAWHGTDHTIALLTDSGTVLWFV